MGVTFRAVRVTFSSVFSVWIDRPGQGHRFNNVAKTEIWPEFCNVRIVCKRCTLIVKLLCYYCYGNDCAIFFVDTVYCN
jgi:hypothetical protein